jgi:hypothetical protein
VWKGFVAFDSQWREKNFVKEGAPEKQSQIAWKASL